MLQELEQLEAWMEQADEAKMRDKTIRNAPTTAMPPLLHLPLLRPPFLAMLLLCTSLAIIQEEVEGIERRRFVDYLSSRARVRNRLQRQQQERGGAEDQQLVLDAATATATATAVEDDVEEHYIEQRLDHFATVPEVETTVRSFRQRYFYTSRFVSDDDEVDVESATSASTATNTGTAVLRGVKDRSARTAADRLTYAFICVGGEGPALTKSVLTNSVHCTGDMIELAKRLHTNYGVNVHLYALEHRYYGKSYPKFYGNDGKEESPVSNENLVYLSSRQALADLAHFIPTVVPSVFSSSNPTGHVKVVTFGGSYPGMLAAWARLKYPHLVHAAVSNSAPVQAQLDFPEYNNRVAYDLNNVEVGGSDDCLDIFVEGHAQIANELEKKDADSRRRVAELFNVCGGESSLVDKKNIGAFLGDGVVFVPAQSNDPSCSDKICNIEHLCSSLIAARSITASPLEALAAISNHQRNNTCVDVNWEEAIRYLSSDEAMEEGTRSWLWQTCTEFGFYQTCEASSSCPYGKGYHNINLDLEICDRAFGVTDSKVWANVQQSLEQYGGWDLDASRILFVNGEIDPWAMLGIDFNHGRSSSLPTIWVEGASHHFWTHDVSKSDGDAIKNAREAIYRQVIEWLEVETSVDGNILQTAAIETSR